MPFVCHLCVICVSLVCRSHFVYMSFVCALMSSVCHSYVLVWHLYVTRIYSYVTCMSLVCTRMSPLCHSYVTRLWFPIYFQTKRLIKINVCENFIFKWHLVFELCQAKVLMVFVPLLLSPLVCTPVVVYNFFATTIADNLFDNRIF